MQTYVEPSNQLLCSTPYDHAHFQFNNPNVVEAYRTCRYLNNNLKLFLNTDNTDQILLGFEVLAAEISNHILRVDIGPGKLIQDLTLIVSPEFTLTRDISMWESNGLSNYSAVIYTNFKFPAPTVKPTTIDPGPFSFNLGIVNNSNNHIETVIWDETKNKLILYAANLDQPTVVKDTINIEGTIYQVYDIDCVDGGIL